MQQNEKKPNAERRELFAPARLSDAAETIADIALMNLYWLICCLPVVTIGASTTALYRATFLLQQGEGSVTKNFFSAWKQNFRRSTALWAVVLLAGALFYADWRVLSVYGDSFPLARALRIALLGLALLALFFLQYVFPLVAQFENTLRRTVKNAALLTVRHFPVTILLCALTLLPLICFLTVKHWLFQYGLIWLLGGCAAIVYCKARLLSRVFMKYTHDNTAEQRRSMI